MILVGPLQFRTFYNSTNMSSFRWLIGNVKRKAKAFFNKVRNAKILRAVAFLVSSKSCWC